jgi:[ribosomal protein S18]-alanine N-acetyltransferase
MFDFLKRKRVPDVRRIGPQSAQESARACAAIHAQSFAHPWSANEFEALLAGRDVVAEAAMAKSLFGRLSGRHQKLVGFVLSRRVLDEAEILTIAVAQRLRRRGIGTALLSAHLATLAGLGTKALFLEVEAGNDAALRLYAQFGFAQVGTRKGYYPKSEGEAAAALLLRRDFR